MSEKHQSSDLTDLPKWDRSNQGVYAAVGRICEKLHDRARKIGEGSGPPNLTGIKALRTPQIYETKIGKHLL